MHNYMRDRRLRTITLSFDLAFFSLLIGPSLLEATGKTVFLHFKHLKLESNCLKIQHLKVYLRLWENQ